MYYVSYSCHYVDFYITRKEIKMKLPITGETTLPLSRPLTLYFCGWEQCKRSHSFGPAIRPHYLIHYVLSGQGQYYINGNSYHLVKGDGFLIAPGVTTIYTADEQDPWEYCWIGFDGYDVETILKNCGFTHEHLIFTDTSGGELKNILLNLVQTFKDGDGNEYTYLGLLYLCFSHMRPPSIYPTQMFYVNYLEKALDYMHHNYTYDIKIADMAKYIGIDRTYLFKLFKTYKQISPQQYLIAYRLNIARKLLKESDLSVTEIVYSCGFRDAPSFNKHFKKHMNITPLQYRSGKEHYLI